MCTSVRPKYAPAACGSLARARLKQSSAASATEAAASRAATGSIWRSLISVVGLQELTRRANELTIVEYRPLEIYTALVLEYLALILVVSWLVRRLERRLAAG